MPVDRDALPQIADPTKGPYYSAYTDQDLKNAYRDIGSSIGYATQATDISAQFIGAALGLLVLTSLASLALFSRLP